MSGSPIRRAIASASAPSDDRGSGDGWSRRTTARRARSRARSGSSTTGRASRALSQERDQLPVRARPRPREAPAVAERALREQLGLADARGRGCRREERSRDPGLVTRSGTGVAQQKQDLAAPPLVWPLLQRVEGHAEEPGGLLVGQRRHRLSSSDRRVVDGLRLVADRARLEVVVGDLGDERAGSPTYEASSARATSACRRQRSRDGSSS